MNSPNVLLLTSNGLSSFNVAKHLSEHVNLCAVIVENKVALSRIIRGRIRRYGYMKACGQILFKILIIPLLNFESRQRIKRIISDYHLVNTWISDINIEYINSVNEDGVLELIHTYNPDIIVINGTRILSKKFLVSVKSIPIINMHMGITPSYRGVHGAYWALVEHKPELCGVTIHRVDAGIDTGTVLDQRLITPTAEDTFVTYPILQLIAGLPALSHVVEHWDQLDTLQIQSLTVQSQLRTHPTLWEYLWFRLRKKVK